MADSEEEEERVAALAQAIVQYLTTHPDAADSLVGIRQWWLAGGFLDVPETVVRATLEGLVQSGRITRTTLADGTEVYSRGRRGEQ